MFADIILPFALEKNYTYSIPDDLLASVKPGTRVEVPFRNKTYTGIVAIVHDRKPDGYQTKMILNLPDHLQVVNKMQLDFWEWMASYYLCSTGDVMNAALPAPYKLSSETILLLHDASKIDAVLLNDREYIISEALTLQKELTLLEIQKILRQKSVQPVIKSLIEKGIAGIKEELKEGFKPRTEKYIALTTAYRSEDALRALFDRLENAGSEKQLHALMIYYQDAGDRGYIKRSLLLRKADISAAVLKTMIKNEIFYEYTEEVSRLQTEYQPESPALELSPSQRKAMVEIEEKFRDKNVVLLHGVTGSGKTEIYIELMKKFLQEGRQILYMLPEIALTAQTVNRLKKYFGAVVGVYHSKFSQNERIEIWQKIISGGYKIILSARSGLFLPFTDLGFVIVDEEHDYSYKQHDPNPRYHARDAAIYLAHLHGAKTLLGTATPSVETYYNSETGKYGRVSLTERYTQIALPELEIEPLTETFSKNKSNQVFFSEKLRAAIQSALVKKEQVIIFQNRRGFAPYIICESCGWVPQCINCDVKLVYHKYADELRCHYCGYKHKSFPACPACGSTRILIQGLGTEKVEDELQLYFPEHSIARLDLDAVRSKHGHEKIIRSFENGEIDILVGTQMITKGLDFDNVNLVGIINADQTWNFADFRTHERSFQMLTQVSGRAGRKNKKGLVVIQAINTKHPVLIYLKENNYALMYENEILQRRQFSYPPFSRLIRIIVKHRDMELTGRAAAFLVSLLVKKLHKNVLGPTVPSVGRIKGKFQLHILLKLPPGAKPLSDAKLFIREVMRQMESSPDFKKADLVIDVDPL